MSFYHQNNLKQPVEVNFLSYLLSLKIKISSRDKSTAEQTERHFSITSADQNPVQPSWFALSQVCY